MNATFTPFDAAEYLGSDEAIAAYLDEVIADGSPDLLLSALSDIARARGMTKVAEDSGLGRESLYKALRPGAKPGFVTVSKIMSALGVRVVVRAAVPSGKKQATVAKDHADTAAIKRATKTDVAAPKRRARTAGLAGKAVASAPKTRAVTAIKNKTSKAAAAKPKPKHRARA